MNLIVAQFRSTPSRSRGAAVALFTTAFAFWPAFMLLTVLDERAGLLWLQTGNPAIWLPIAALAMLAAVLAPFLLKLNVSRKIAASIASLAGYFIVYGVVVLTGVSFLNWGD